MRIQKGAIPNPDLLLVSDSYAVQQSDDLDNQEWFQRISRQYWHFASLLHPIDARLLSHDIVYIEGLSRGQVRSSLTPRSVAFPAGAYQCAW